MKKCGIQPKQCLKGEFLTLKEESLKINHLSFHPKKLEKEKQMKGGGRGGRNTDKSKIIEIDVAIKQKYYQKLIC